MKLLDPKVGDFFVSSIDNDTVGKILSIEKDDEDRFQRKGTIVSFDGASMETKTDVGLGYLKDYRAVIMHYENRIEDFEQQIVDMQDAIEWLKGAKGVVERHLEKKE